MPHGSTIFSLVILAAAAACLIACGGGGGTAPAPGPGGGAGSATSTTETEESNEAKLAAYEAESERWLRGHPFEMIPGLTVADVAELIPPDFSRDHEHSDLKASTIRQLGPIEHEWTWHMRTAGREFELEAFGPGETAIFKVRAQVLRVGNSETNRFASAARTALANLAAIKYQGADPDRAHDWLLANYDRQNAEIIIGGVTFDYSNSRDRGQPMLTIQAVQFLNPVEAPRPRNAISTTAG